MVFGPAIPAAELQITDATHKVTALRHMKSRLKTALETLLEENAFAGRQPQPEASQPEAAVQPPVPDAQGPANP